LRNTVRSYLKKYPKLREVELDLREARIDMAEDVIDWHTENKSLTAAMFVCRTIGRHRGYSESTEISTPDGKFLDLSMTERDAGVL
jgi:hypothetical protein